jgi:hypothetical protein
LARHERPANRADTLPDKDHANEKKKETETATMPRTMNNALRPDRIAFDPPISLRALRAKPCRTMKPGEQHWIRVTSTD